MKVQPLPWDTEFFGFPIGLVNLDWPDDRNSLRDEIQAVMRKFRCIYLFSPQALTEEQEHFGGNLRARLADNKLTLRKILSETPGISPVSEADPLSDRAALVDLALVSGRYSRFSTDPGFRPFFPRMYETWILNSLNGLLADKTYVIRDEETVVGMVTCGVRDGIGKIGLIATNPGYQGRGLGKYLLSATEAYYLDQGTTDARIVTQAANQQACSFYIKNGYQPFNSVFIYHLWQPS